MLTVGQNHVRLIPFVGQTDQTDQTDAATGADACDDEFRYKGPSAVLFFCSFPLASLVQFLLRQQQVFVRRKNDQQIKYADATTAGDCNVLSKRWIYDSLFERSGAQKFSLREMQQSQIPTPHTRPNTRPRLPGAKSSQNPKDHRRFGQTCDQDCKGQRPC